MNGTDPTLLRERAPLSSPSPQPRTAPPTRSPAARTGAAGRATWQGPRVVTASTPAELASHSAAWEDLAREAIEPNPFHERWMLAPALEAAGAMPGVRVVLVYGEVDGRIVLSGLFPVELATRFRGLPLRHARIWRHIHAYLSTPLLRRGRARETLAAFYDWLARDPGGARVMEWSWVGADGPFFAALTDVLRERGLAAQSARLSARCVLRRRGDAESCLRAHLSADARKDLRRRERRLREAGAVSYTELGFGEDARPWIDAFLELEASGWKGRLGSALASVPAHRGLFTQLALEAARRGALAMRALRLDARPIAMQCDLIAGTAAFAFKIAYDERYARYSPGRLLEVEHLRRFHARPTPEWVDSCAEGHDEPAWPDRRALATLVTSTGRRAGSFAVAALPLARWAYRKLRRDP